MNKKTKKQIRREAEQQALKRINEIAILLGITRESLNR